MDSFLDFLKSGKRMASGSGNGELSPGKSGGIHPISSPPQPPAPTAQPSYTDSEGDGGLSLGGCPSPCKRLDDELKRNLETLPSFSSDEEDSVGKNQDLQKSISSAISALYDTPQLNTSSMQPPTLPPPPPPPEPLTPSQQQQQPPTLSPQLPTHHQSDPPQDSHDQNTDYGLLTRDDVTLEEKINDADEDKRDESEEKESEIELGDVPKISGKSLCWIMGIVNNYNQIFIIFSGFAFSLMYVLISLCSGFLSDSPNETFQEPTNKTLPSLYPSSPTSSSPSPSPLPPISLLSPLPELDDDLAQKHPPHSSPPPSSPPALPPPILSPLRTSPVASLQPSPLPPPVPSPPKQLPQAPPSPEEPPPAQLLPLHLALKQSGAAITGETEEDESESGGEGIFRERDEFVVRIEDIKTLKVGHPNTFGHVVKLVVVLALNAHGLCLALFRRPCRRVASLLPSGVYRKPCCRSLHLRLKMDRGSSVPPAT